MMGMGWISSFNKAAGPRRYLIAGIFSLPVAGFDWIKPYLKGVGMTEFTAIPSWIFGIITALGFALYWTIQRLVILDRRIGGARAELAKLRNEGVEIRNIGTRLKDEKAWVVWKKLASDWQEKVYEKLKEFSEADAELFNVLDVVPKSPRVGCFPYNAEHVKLYGEHDCRLDRLWQMIDKFEKEYCHVANTSA